MTSLITRSNHVRWLNSDPFLYREALLHLDRDHVLDLLGLLDLLGPLGRRHDGGGHRDHLVDHRNRRGGDVVVVAAAAVPGRDRRFLRGPVDI